MESETSSCGSDRKVVLFNHIASKIFYAIYVCNILIILFRKLDTKNEYMFHILDWKIVYNTRYMRVSIPFFNCTLRKTATIFNFFFKYNTRTWCVHVNQLLSRILLVYSFLKCITSLIVIFYTLYCTVPEYTQSNGMCTRCVYILLLFMYLHLDDVNCAFARVWFEHLFIFKHIKLILHINYILPLHELKLQAEKCFIELFLLCSSILLRAGNKLQ